MKIDEEFTKKCKKWAFSGHKFIISKYPKYFVEKGIPPVCKESFLDFVDEKIIMLNNTSKDSNFDLAKCSAIGAAIMLFMGVFFDKELSIPTIGLTLFLLIIAFCFWNAGRKLSPYVRVTFYRKEGLIELPKSDKGDYFWIRFQDLVAGNKNIGGVGICLIFTRDFRFIPLKYQYITICPYEPLDAWSFYVWYMDKNRPLPPGAAFAPYRKKDYERRKAEGFPSPLFQSLIPTPDLYQEEDERKIREN